VVVPSRESDLPYIKHNLHTYLRVGAEELILCVDEDSNQKFLDNVSSLYESIKKEYSVSELKILQVERRSDYSFHQAWVRRKGFLEAKNDVILTGDIDLHINRSVLNAVNIVGIDNIGLASVQKFPFQSNLRRSIITTWRLLYMAFIRYTYYSVFTGLYALYRPYWLETEDDGIKKLQNVKYGGMSASIYGEDTYLRDCMARKYRCVYLRNVGAIDYGIALHDNHSMQFAVGRYSVHSGLSLWRILVAAFAYYHPDRLVGYFYEKERVKKGLVKIGDVV